MGQQDLRAQRVADHPPGDAPSGKPLAQGMAGRAYAGTVPLPYGDENVKPLPFLRESRR